MKLHYIGSLAVAAASGAGIMLAPIAAASVDVHQTPGNAQVTAAPGEAATHAAQLQQPFGGDINALLFHH